MTFAQSPSRTSSGCFASATLRKAVQIKRGTDRDSIRKAGKCGGTSDDSRTADADVSERNRGGAVIRSAQRHVWNEAGDLQRTSAALGMKSPKCKLCKRQAKEKR